MKTPIDVIREALLIPVPCPNCGRTVPCRCLVRDRATHRLDTHAANVEAALVAAGLLPGPEQAEALTETEMQDVARFLAAESRFVRYYDESDPNDDGWRVLLTSSHDVETAYAKAKARHEGGAKDVTDALSRARSLLVGYIAQRRAAKAGE